MMPMKMLSIRSMSKTPSVAKNVRPKNVNSREATSRKIAGRPPIFTNGSPTNSTMRLQPTKNLLV
jgi:hypothetical protein